MRVALAILLLTSGCVIRAAKPDQFLRAPAATEVPPDPSPGCTHRLGTGPGWLTMQSGGRERQYLLRLPKDASDTTPMPLVLNFPGFLETAKMQELFSFMTDAASARGMVLAYPEGIGRSWNAGSCCGRAFNEKIDDVQFVRDLVDKLENQLCIDKRRVFATGMSNGAILSFRLACEMSDTFAAIAPVAGAEAIPECKPSRAVSVLSFHGTWDHVVYFNGGGIGRFISAPESIRRWAMRNGCKAAPTKTIYDVDEVECRASVGCPPGVDVEFCRIEHGGHTWPGGALFPTLGHTTSDIDATGTMLDFFLAHPKR